MKLNYLKSFFLITAMVLFFGIPAYAVVGIDTVSQVSGRIMWVDLKLGTLQIKISQNSKDTKNYRITRYETRVKDPSDKKFLTIDDLQPGENITLDVVDNHENKIIEKIVAESLEASDFQVASGQIVSIDGQSGALVLQETKRNGVEENTYQSNFIFDPNSVVVLQAPSIQPVALVLKPGDQVRIVFVLKDNKQQVYSITLYSVEHSTTTTVTTTTSTQ